MNQNVIRVSYETVQKLRSIGRKGETDENIIKNLLELYDEKYGKSQKELDAFHKHPSE